MGGLPSTGIRRGNTETLRGLMTSTRVPRPARSGARRKRRVRTRRVIGVLAAAPFLRVGASGLRFTAQAAMAQRRGVPMSPDVPIPRPSLALAAGVALDELFMLPAGLAGSIATPSDYVESSAELDAAVRYYDANGWLDDPAGYFQVPPTPQDVRSERAVWRRRPFEVIRFESGWQPRPDEPGAERWRSFEANREMSATVLRHDDDQPRPWLIAVHGAGMGRLSDLDTLRLRRIHHELGVNLVLPTLPLHGHRRAGLRSRQTFVSTVYPVNNVFGIAQAVWDVRRVIRWLREDQQATAIGLYGLSLGSFVASVLSTLDDDLDCVIAVVPSGDIAAPLKATEPSLPALRRAHISLHDWRAHLVLGVVSPLAQPCRVPVERRYIVACQGDRLGTAAGAVMLWRHWDKPRTDWYPVGHTTITRAAEYEPRLRAMLRDSGVAAS